jgi:hypothetical protein
MPESSTSSLKYRRIQKGSWVDPASHMCQTASVQNWLVNVPILQTLRFKELIDSEDGEDVLGS